MGILTLDEMASYDASLQMFREQARSPDPRRLRFLRWLVENNRFGRPPIGPASGEFAQGAVEDVRPSADSRPAQP